ncbi:type II toxin-antitoxin system Phd/YefM family antitoxin [Pseudonocardia sp. CA-107938]|uniref:type II toxin-antitoxin system Phd/YefM family antitoxin n=1 Tax=Pseudonocardia sp. CA-107938 TaxID=3240021 RepID=UPI003D8CB456
MSEYGVHEAKTHFSKLVDKVLAGEEVVITRSGEPLIKWVPVQRKRKPNFGFARGQFTIPDDFDETPEEFAEYM